jgi:ligand-binding sensor domain-containing protein/two-component sensor histidine kinase
MKRRFVICLLTLISFAQAVAQQFHYNQFTTAEGLPTNSVRSSLIDSRDWLWIGTDAGVVRYQDGFFVPDNRLDTLSGMRIWAMIEDNQDKIWFGTYGNGLARFDGDSLVWFNSENSALANDEIRILKFLPEYQQLLIGGKEVFAVYLDDSLINFKLDSMAISARHFTYFLENEDKILALNNEPAYTLTYDPEMKKLERTTREFYSETKIWSGIHTSSNETYYGFNRDSYYYKSADHEFVKPGIGQVFEWLEDPYGNIWAAAWEAEGPGGLFRFNAGEMVNYNKMLGIEKINGWGLEYDPTNNCLWFLSLDQGLIQLPLQIFSSLPLPFSDKSETVSNIQQDSAKNTWISTTKGLWRHNGQTYEAIPAESFYKTLLTTYLANYDEWFSILKRLDLNNKNISDTAYSYYDKSGDFTVYNLVELIKVLELDNNSFYEIDESTFLKLKAKLIQKLNTATKKPQPIKFNKILPLSQDKILVSTSLGTFSYDINRQKIKYLNSLWQENVTLNQDTLYYTFNFNLEVMRAVLKGDETIGLPWMTKEKHPDLPQFTIASEARAGRIWFASRFQGLYSYYADSFTHLNKLYPGLSNNFTSLAFVGDSLLVAGSSDGLIHLFSNDSDTPKLLKSFSPNDGITGRTIQWVKCDKEGFLWAGTNSALNRFDLRAWLKDHTNNISAYGNPDGYNAFDVNAATLDDEGRIWLENGDELLLINTPKANTTKNAPLKPELRQLDLFLKPFDWPAQKNIPHFTKVPLNPTFKHDQNYLSFHFGSNNRIEPEKDFYSYRLLGLDTTWSQSSTEKLAVFTNLDPGDYILEVQLCKPIHKIQGSISYPFSILKPWWQQWWFIILFVLAAAALLLAGMNWRIRYLREQQKRKYEIQQQLAELKLQALQAQMNPHFIFNVLTAIQNAILKNEIDNAIRYLSDVSRLMRRTLDYASEKFISLEEEVEYIENYIRLEKIRMNGKLQTHIFIDPKLDLQNTQIPPMLIQPLIENAIKHGANKAEETGIINIRFEQISPEGYQCIVEDNGPGIAPESTSTHKSRGLEMIYTRIQLLNEEFGATAFAFAVSNKIKPESGARMEIQFKMPLE